MLFGLINYLSSCAVARLKSHMSDVYMQYAVLYFGDGPMRFFIFLFPEPVPLVAT